MGIRQPVPNARPRTFNTGGAWRRLNSALRNRDQMHCTSVGSSPAAINWSGVWCCSTSFLRMGSRTA